MFSHDLIANISFRDDAIYKLAQCVNQIKLNTLKLICDAEFS